MSPETPDTFQIATPELFVNAALFDAKLLQLLQVKIYDRARGEKIVHEWKLRPGAVRFWAHVRSAGPRDYLVHEWHYGGYEREVDLPAGFGAGVEATLTNGQLAIRILRGEPSTLTIQPSGA